MITLLVTLASVGVSLWSASLWSERLSQTAATQARLYETQGEIALREGETRRAFFLFKRAVERDPRCAEAQFQLATLYYRVGLTDETLHRLQEVTRLAPENAVYWNALGAAMQSKMEKFAEAEDALRRAVTLQPENAVYIRDLADLQAKRKKPREAEENYRKALAADPENREAQFGLGRLLVESNQTLAHLTEAEDLLENVAAADPSHAGAMFDLGRLALRQNRPADAVRWLEAAVALSPRNQYAHFQLARAYQQTGDTKRAAQVRAAFEERSRADRDLTNLELQAVQSKADPVLRLKLARALAESGASAKAINQYRVFLARDPKNEAVRRELAKFEGRLRTHGVYPDMALFDAAVQMAKR